MSTSDLQKRAFLEGEGDRWFQRNAAHLSGGERDVVTSAIGTLGLKAKSVLEIGSANGHRLASIATALGARCAGVDPSAAAIESGLKQYPDLDLRIGSADDLPFDDGAFDMVIVGFCMYLVDPSLHLRTVGEVDRVLADKGTLAVFDFIADKPYFNDYSHLPGLRAHKMEFSKLFLAHPAYSLVHRQLGQKNEHFLAPDLREGVDVLVKDMAAAFPPNPRKYVMGKAHE